MYKVGTITASYMWEGANYQRGVPWNDLMASFEQRWTPPRLDALLGRIAALRMPFVELWKVHVQDASWDPGMVADLFAKHGVLISSYCVGGVNSEENLERSYRFAKALGAPLLSGYLSCQNTEQLLDALERYGDRYGINYAIEPHAKSYSLVDPAQLRDVLDRHSKRIGICPDPGWFRGQGFDPVAAVEQLKDRVYHTHLRCTLGADGQRVVGSEEILRILKASGYAGVYSIEHEPPHDPTAELAEARDFILRVLAEPDEDTRP
jgi:sugar phosphate isomerase/epimerase